MAGNTEATVSPLIDPYGGRLVDLLVADEERDELRARAGELPPVRLSPRSTGDLELLATGAFSPLEGFMGRADYARVLGEMRLAAGTLFPVPITLPIPVNERSGVALGREVALRGPHNELLAVLAVEEVFEWDARPESIAVCGSDDARHPLVAEMASWGGLYASGPLRVIEPPHHFDFPGLRRTPAEVRQLLAERGHGNVVAFQTRNPMHRVHEELTRRAAAKVDGTLLIHPVVGVTKPGDVDHYTRVRTYKALVEAHYDPGRTVLSLLPLAMRMAGPREVVWHAIIRRNFGANHFIVGRDHASPGNDSKGEPFYGPYDAQELLTKHRDEVGVTMVPFSMMAYLPDEDRYEESALVPEGTKVASISGTQIRSEYLARGRKLPEWFSRPEVAGILQKAFPPKELQGFCVWFPGLPCAGKSTIAEVLAVMLMERGRRVTVLDGDVVRTHLSKGLGFSREDRDTNIMRIGVVASALVRHHGAAICAAVSPYAAARGRVRSLMEAGRFVLVHVDTPVEVCEKRDVKGMYSRARAGEITGFTGVDAPYETPAGPEVVVRTTECTPEEGAGQVVRHLIEAGFLPSAESDAQ